MDWLDDPAALVATLPPLVLPLVVFVSSALEYVFPPYWGDTVILLGFFLAGQGAVPAWTIFVGSVLGGVLGATIAYGLGRRYGLRAVRIFSRRGGRSRSRERLDRLFARFGERVLLLNRFLPVVRGILLYGAGGMQLRPRPVLVYTAIGNVAWVALLMGVGLLTGGTWEQIQESFRHYSWFGAVVAGVLVLGGLVWMFIQYRRTRRTTRETRKETSS